jgi:hypothetical protein
MLRLLEIATPRSSTYGYGCCAVGAPGDFNCLISILLLYLGEGAKKRTAT